MGIEAPALIDAAQQCQRQQQEQAVSAQERSPWLVSSDVEAASASDGTSTEVPYSNLVELPGGCLCCSVRGEMLQALEALLARYKAQIDAVLIETNGAADPQPICEGLWSDEQLMGSLYLDGVVCLIDAARPHTVLAPRPLSGRAPASGAEEGAGKRQAAEVGAGSPPKGALPVSLEAHGGLGITALKQVACADCVLLTKVDLCEDQQVLQLHQQISTLNPGARVFRCSQGAVPLHALLGLEAYSSGNSSSKLLTTTPFTPEAAAATAAAHDLWKQQQQQHQHQQHECETVGNCCHDMLGGLNSVLLRFSLGGSSTKSAPEGPPRLFSLRRLRQTVGELLWGEDGIDGGEASGAPCEGSGETIFRCKGLFPAWRDFPDEAEDGIGRWWIYELQGVGRTFEIRRVRKTCAAIATSALAADGSGAVEAKFLFVGLCLRKQELEQRLLKCLGEEERTQVLADVRALIQLEGQDFTKKNLMAVYLVCVESGVQYPPMLPFDGVLQGWAILRYTTAKAAVRLRCGFSEPTFGGCHSND
ncbi:uncharacterized protein LOC34619355 [Cyclospora cayetanensis]|uniref:Uncharacterized protein LOC34619355 n=1 Tax=Cyclospora cayetanensis TaxID=88456 RepID=A0A6P6RWN4_9EIME|nr:uncharacterized protein LOC34619355 [Cyclospora cayetanensis]